MLFLGLFFFLMSWQFTAECVHRFLKSFLLSLSSSSDDDEEDEVKNKKNKIHDTTRDQMIADFEKRKVGKETGSSYEQLCK